MPYARSAGPKIYFETQGATGGEPVVLLEGLGAQLVGWRDGFVARLLARGLFVIRLDNRDIGLSEKMGDRATLEADYGMEEMAGDVCAVLDALGLDSAHIVGQSMGGVIAQTLAIVRPERVRSLVLIYTTPAYDPAFISDQARQYVAVQGPIPEFTRERAIENRVEGERLNCASTSYVFDEAWIRELAALSYDRCYRPDGVARQASALQQWGDPRASLQQLTTPTAIIHGREDRLLKVEGAFELGRLIKDSEVHIYPGMGHQVVEPLWDEFATIIDRTVRRGSSGRFLDPSRFRWNHLNREGSVSKA